jgi:hypothetical protein
VHVLYPLALVITAFRPTPFQAIPKFPKRG